MKDAVAALLFLVSIVIVTNCKVPVETITSCLVVGFVVDSLFTVNPKWHCEEWSESSVAKYIVMAQAPLFAAFVLKMCM